jgi:hypothetical protein
VTSQIDTTKPIFGLPTTQSVRDNFTTAANEITTLQQQTSGSPFLPLAGGRMTGAMYLFNDPTDAMMPATKGYVDASAGGGGGGGIPEAPTDGQSYGRSDGAWLPVLPIAGAALTGPLVLAADPTTALGAVTKQYADAIAAGHLTDAPNDANTYGRHAAAWAQVLPIAGGVLTGSLGLNVAIPTAPAPGAAHLLAPVISAGNYLGFNAYWSVVGASAQANYRSAGFASVFQLDQSLGRLSFGVVPSGAADASFSLSKAAFTDVAGNLQLASTLIVPTDANVPTLAAPELTVSGHVAFNLYLPTPGNLWKNIATGYGGNIYVDSAAGSMSFLLYPSTSAGGAQNAPASSMLLSQAGMLSVSGTVVSGNGRLIAQGSTNPSVSMHNTGSANNSLGFWNSGTGLAFGGIDGNGVPTTFLGQISTAGQLILSTGGMQSFGPINVATQYASDFSVSADSTNRIVQFMTGWYFQCISSSGQLFWNNSSAGWGAVFQTNADFQIRGVAYKPGGGAWADSSDIRTKEVTSEYTQGLAAIVALRPVVYRKKGNEMIGRDAPPPPPVVPADTDAPPAAPRVFGDLIGLVAQECELVMPEMISFSEGIVDGELINDLRILDMTALPLALVNAVKEIDARLRAGGL